ncbi:hypothetical protein ACFV8E_08610 [Streptomyces sp. NPDC059849]|uniref:hypothetical protein n=1 Tax=Streptomyces sp. NPDC059849 TaxID=3346969 RepID=UPI00365E9812
MHFDDDEPVFKKSRLGTNRYEYNPRNPVGFALIVISVLLVGGMLLLMHFRAGPFAHPSAPAPVSTGTDDTWRYVPGAEDPGDVGNPGSGPSTPPEGDDPAP